MYVLSYVLHVRMYDSQSVLTPVSQPARGIDFYLFRTCITVPTIPSYQSYSTCVRYVVCTYVPETLESEQRMDSFPWAERGHKSSYSQYALVRTSRALTSRVRAQNTKDVCRATVFSYLKLQTLFLYWTMYPYLIQK